MPNTPTAATHPQSQTLTIGKTTYVISVKYSGKETITKKLERLIERKLENGR